MISWRYHKMECSQPSPIKEYYIAYFDILGYRQFFQEQQEQAGDLLNQIHVAIETVKNNLTASNKVDFLKDHMNVDWKIKIFSDNILICLECGNSKQTEKSRALFFLLNISEIQRYFIINHDLFLRGGITKGKLSYNDDYVFGEGLIEAVGIEEQTVYPRITLSPSLFEFFSNITSYNSEDREKALSIEKHIQNKEEITLEDQEFYNYMLRLANSEYFFIKAFYNMTVKWYDGIICISYLYKLNPLDYLPLEALSKSLGQLGQVMPNVAENLNCSLSNIGNDIENMLSKHKQRIEDKIRKYGNYDDFDVTLRQNALQREHILKKYIWTMKYHNDMCCRYGKMEHFINSTANCDAKFMLLRVDLV